MSSQRQVTVRDLAEEAKKRIVFLAVCVVGLSYLMSLTSSSVWVNLPAAAFLIILLRYFTLDFEMRKKAAAYNSKPSSENAATKSKPAEFTKVLDKCDWRKKVNSPAVEEAIDNFTRHLISEWVTDLWYSKLTPDKEGPEELVQILNDVLGEISRRSRNINLIDLLTRDLVNLICNHLELFRVSQTKFENQESGLLFIEQRDEELRRVLAAENKLHPALFSAEAEHKVLQHLMDGLISFAFRPEDLQCAFFRYIVRELLACAVMRPVLNLANPRFVNEKIENLVISKANKGVVAAEEASQSKTNGSSKIPSDHFSRFLDPTVTGVELVQLKSNQSMNGTVASNADAKIGSSVSKDPLLSIDTRSSRSWNSLPMNSQTRDAGGIHRFRSGGEWGEMLDIMSRRKTATLAPENLENMWAKGRNYRKKEERLIEQVPQKSTFGKFVTGDNSKIPKSTGVNCGTKVDSSLPLSVGIHRSSIENLPHCRDENMSNNSQFASYHDDNEHGLIHVDEDESGSSSSYTSEEEDANSITGLDSPGTKVWDGKTNRNLAVSHIHHPLENPNHTGKKPGRRSSQFQRLSGLKSGRKRSRSSIQGVHVWQEVERTSFLSGDGQDILGTKAFAKADESTDDSDVESLDRIYSGTTASSSMSSISAPQNHSLTASSLKNSLMVDSFFRLRCEVLGANIVKSGSRTFAVYSISVADANNNSWSIKRRFRHFEELHQRLKEYQEYDLHLPPKHFLSTGLDVPLIRERCILLDIYLKKLLQLPTVSGSIEVWDFLSVDSQTYVFSNSFSIIETLSVDLEAKPSQAIKKYPNSIPLLTTPKEQGTEHKESALQAKHNLVPHGLGMIPKGDTHSPGKRLAKPLEDSRREKEVSTQTSESLHDSATDATLPTEWVPPNLTVPILDLVDVIFQLQDVGWIRRKAFWAVKQILQLGMGDALDDWLLEKIQLLRTGSVVASVIKRLEQILWPDGIFITKHPKRRRPAAINSPHSSPHTQQPADISSPKQGSPLCRQTPVISSPRLSEEQQQEAYRRAKFVYELMIDKAPAAVVSLVGRKEYEQCIKDVYFFLQSSVCLKLLAFNILELLLLSAFPEMDCVVRQVHEEKHRFGEFKPN